MVPGAPEGPPPRAARLRPGRATLGARIALAFLLAVASLGGVQAWLVVQQGPVADALALITEGYLPLARQVARLEQDQDRVQRDLARLDRNRPRPATGEASSAVIYTQGLRDNLEIARIVLRSMQARKLPAAEVAVVSKSLSYVDELDRLFADYEQGSAAWVAKVEAGVAPEGVEPEKRALRNTGRQLDEAFDKLGQTIDGRVTSLTRSIEQMQARATAVAVTAGGAAVLVALGLLAAVLVALRPIARLTAEVQRVAEGERGARVEVGGADEIGVLAAEFNAMAQAIEQRDRSLTERAEELDRLSRYLASVVDALDEGLVVVEHGLVSLTNPAAARVWGAVDRAAPPEVLRDVLTPGSHLLEGPEGTQHTVRVVPFGADGLVAVLTDVTAQVRAQERLARSERLALVGQMLAQITHEVRNPLNALSLNAELLGDEVTSLDPEHRTEAADILGMISREVDRLTDVTGHYLQLARRPPAQLAPTELVALVEDVERLLRPEVEERGARLVVHTAAIPAIPADGNQLRQALINVVRNALEAPAHTITVDLGAEGDAVVLAVRDDGPGMDDTALQHATDPFYSTKVSGTGLGLAITRQILEDHEGSVRIARLPEGGTEVALVLPRTSGAGAV